MTDIERECYNGIVLDSRYPYKIVSYSIPYFDVHNDAVEPPFDWETTRVYEKINGTFLCMYYYESNWHVASRCTCPPASSSPRLCIDITSWYQHS